MFSTTKWTVSEAEKEAAVKRMQARKAESEGGEAKRQKVDTFASPGAGQPTIADAGDDVCDSTSITNMSSSAATNSPNSANDLALKPKGAKAPVAKAPAPRTTRNSTAAVATAPATAPVAVLTHDFILNAAQAAEVLGMTKKVLDKVGRAMGLDVTQFKGPDLKAKIIRFHGTGSVTSFDAKKGFFEFKDLQEQDFQQPAAQP